MASKRFLSPVLALMLVLVVTGSAFACTSIPCSKGATVDGSVFTSHTDDSGTDTPQVTVVPAADWKPGTMRKVLRNTDFGPYGQIKNPIYSPGEIPQVAHTYGYFNSAYSFQNEKQVGMGETTIGGARENSCPAGWFDLVELERVGLERGATAREAIQVMGALAEQYGYCVSGECLTVIDKKEAWQFEVFGGGPLWSPGCGKPGAVWAAARIPEGEIGVSANRSRIGTIDLSKPDYYMASKHVFSMAEEMGLWDSKSGKPFKIYETYGKKAVSPYNARREWRVFSLLAPSQKLDPWLDYYPFSIKPDKKVSVSDIFAITRDHYEGTEFDLTKGLDAGPFGTPNRYPTSGSVNPPNSVGWERAISIFRCNYSTVVTARDWLPDPIGGLTWFAWDAAYSSCYVPLYCNIAYLPKSYAIGDRGGSFDVFARQSAWWAFNFVSNWADLKYSYMIKDIQAVQQPFEKEFLAMQPAIEKVAVELYNKDPQLCKDYLTTYSNSCANRTVDAWWKLASQLVGCYADGYVYGTNEKYAYQTVGYPADWLKAVGFGLSTIRPELRTK